MTRSSSIPPSSAEPTVLPGSPGSRAGRWAVRRCALCTSMPGPNTPTAARSLLRSQQLVPLQVQALSVDSSAPGTSRRAWGSRAFNNAQRTVWTRQLAGLVGAPKMSAYSASKHAVIGLTKSAAVEYGRKGIRVNAVGPGRIETEGTAGRTGGNEDSLIGASAIALGRWGRANDIAEAIGFLCSPQSSYITGQVIWVDGGLTIGTNDYLRHMRTSKK